MEQQIFVDDDGNMWGEDEWGRYRRFKALKSMNISL